MDDYARIMAKVTPTEGCWWWQPKSRAPRGNGSVWYQGKVQQAHRVVWELLVGPVPAGMTLDHLCERPACVNPWHLEPVTALENVLRGRSHGWESKCPAGHLYAGANLIQVRRRGGVERRCRTCVNTMRRKK